MRQEDINNKYNTRPGDFKEHLDNSTGVYTKTVDDGEIKSLNKDFVQINNKYLDVISELSLVSSVASSIFFLFIKRMENNNTYIVSNKELATTLKKSEDTIQRGIKVLKDRNFVVVYFRSNSGTCYFINPVISCKCSSSYKQILTLKYLKINNSTYKMTDEILDVKSLVKEDRLILKSDLKRQLEELKRPDNVKIHSMLEVFDWFKGRDQIELLSLLHILESNISFTDIVKEFTDTDVYDLLENMDDVEKVEFIQNFDKKEHDETKSECDKIVHDLKKKGIKEKRIKKKTEEEIAYEMYVQEENEKKKLIQEQTSFDDDFSWFERNRYQYSDEQLYQCDLIS